MRHRDQGFARGKVRIGQHLGPAINPPGRNRVRDHQGFKFGHGHARSPLCDQRVQLSLPLAARDVRGIVRVGGQLGLVHGGAQPREYRVAIAADHVLAVLARIDVARRDTRQD